MVKTLFFHCRRHGFRELRLHMLYSMTKNVKKKNFFYEIGLFFKSTCSFLVITKF